ncbi:ABC transporter ATP-binding protein [Paenibacillus sp. NEAU-GSW1]|uniref:ABC transporter ATP-binding protein n=1 Tax=Paenibacillus sp. NEAU-GSW1 TaxID=2682486 RepID=UPI0012E2D2B0|nr:ABC transporter ATP-binding protein [Paenibacillus sp. NEAU-GSW1]MUT67431.1 ATP-binding cassette domain-containing protein [Paenibacillus sp. NEAU-GSW1]
MTQDTCIRIEGVNKYFDKKSVLNDIRLSISRSEVFGLLGPSGSGKTTLIKLIVGIERAASGDLYVLNEKMPNLSMMHKIGYMAQSDALYSELTAVQNLDFFASIFGLKGAIKKQRIAEVTELVNLSHDLNKLVINYSGGMKRRLSLAIAMLHKPEILILDEPTVGIDPVLRQSIWGELRRLSKNGTTVLVTTHVMDEAEKCDHLGMIRDGRLIAIGSPEELKQESSSESLEQAFLKFGGVTA